MVLELNENLASNYDSSLSNSSVKPILEWQLFMLLAQYFGIKLEYLEYKNITGENYCA